MKKLLSIAFVMASMMLVVISANAQTWKNDSGRKAENRKDDDRYDRNDRNQFPNRGNAVVKTYTETKITQVGKKLYRETYEVKVFRNGKTTSKLLTRVEVKNRRGKAPKGQQSVNTYFHTATIWENGREYRVTYKITEHRNGNVDSEIVNKVKV